MIVNRFEQKMFSSGLRKADIEQVLGDAFAACIPNNYGLVREAIDRGVPLDEVKPGNKITAAAARSWSLPQPTQAGDGAVQRRAARSSNCPWRASAIEIGSPPAMPTEQGTRMAGRFTVREAPAPGPAAGRGA